MVAGVIGRGAERDRLRRGVQCAAAGASCAVAVVGDVGMGKTSLLDWAAELAGGDRFGLAVHRVSGESPQAALAALDTLRPDLAADPVRRLVTVDDVQLLDAAGSAAVARLLESTDRPSGGGLVVIVAGLPSAALLRRSCPTVLPLLGLTVPQARSLMSMHGATTVDPDVTGALVRLTGGSPLALRELAGSLTDEQLAGRRPLPDPLPLGVQGRTSFGRLLQTLPERTRLALLVAAIGQWPEPAVLLPALTGLGLHPQDLDPAVDADLLRAGTWHVARPLLGAAVRGLASAEQTRQVHSVLARAYEQTDLAQHARHLAAAGGGVDEVSAAALERAAQVELQRGQVNVAAPLQQLAADLSPAGASRVRRLVAAAEAHVSSGQPDAASAAVEAALSADPAPELSARALCVKAELSLWGTATSTDLAQLARDAERVAPQDPRSAATILLNAAVCAENLGELPDALGLARRSVALMPDGEHARRALADAVLGQLTTLVTGRSDASPEPMSHAEVRRNLHGSTATCPSMVAQWLLWCERYDDAHSILQAQLDVARQSSLTGVLPHALVLSADVAWWQGRWPTGQGSATAARLAAAQVGQVGLLGYAHAFEALYALQREDHERVARALQDAEDVAERSGIVPATLCATWVRLHAALAGGELGTAMVLGARAEQLRRRLATSALTSIPFLPEYVEAAVRARHQDAPALLAHLAGFAMTNESAWTRAAWLRCTGLSGQLHWQECFEESLSLTPAERTPFEHARTLACWGEQLLASGRRREARRELSRADAMFEGLGSALWRRQVSGPLARAGVQVTAPAQSPVSLTEQEVKVCVLVAGGATNRSTAHALSLSEKTVEYHLGKVLAKTGAANRTQLARLLGEGLLDQTAGPVGHG
jgi:DNA-binding CsgD family transcriptional regulator